MVYDVHMTKAKPPFQLLIVDDDGREVFTRDVDLTNENGLISLMNPEQANGLIFDMARAIHNPTVDSGTNTWYAA